MTLELQMSASHHQMVIRLSSKQLTITSKVFYVKVEGVWKDLFLLDPLLNKVGYRL